MSVYTVSFWEASLLIRQILIRPHLLKILLSSSGMKLRTKPQMPDMDLEYIALDMLDFGLTLLSSLLSMPPPLPFRMGVFTLLLYLT